MMVVSSAFDTKPFEKRVLGSFYTPKEVATHLIDDIITQIDLLQTNEEITVCDPFCGDGRLLRWIGIELKDRFPKNRIYLEGWDIDETATEHANNQMNKAFETEPLVSYKVFIEDSFVKVKNLANKFNIVITNPPWETIKPDWREIKKFSDDKRAQIKLELKELDTRLAIDFPMSQPSRKFAGWGTNLSRVGLELSLSLLNEKGILGIVMPSSFFADMTSDRLRNHFLSNYSLRDVTYYPAEYHLFESVDVEFATCTAVNCEDQKTLNFRVYTESGIDNNGSIELTKQNISLLDGNLPLRLGSAAYAIFNKFNECVALNQVHGHGSNQIWGGREVDETRIKEKFIDKEGMQIMFSRDMERYGTRTLVKDLNRISEENATKSSRYPRIVWRDIARPSMKRRMNASIIKEGILTGNSLGVLHFGNEDYDSLQCILGVLNSFVFEYQIRAILATNHITWGVIKNLKVPNLDIMLKNDVNLLVHRIMKGGGSEIQLEALIAKLYGLEITDYSILLDAFDKINQDDKEKLKLTFRDLKLNGV